MVGLMKPIRFTIDARITGKLGRAGVIETAHGPIRTPAFVAVGTKATVKSLTPELIRSAGIQVVLANTYHLYLEPGTEVIEKAGGFPAFMGWDGPSMTDSGGFQVFSLGAAYGKELSKVVAQTDPTFLIPERSTAGDTPRLATVGADGVSFRSHLDGSLHYLTPETSIAIQHSLGADIIFAFDECTSPAEPRRYQEEALSRTHRWARQSLAYHRSRPESERQALFGIVQGGRDEDLRRASAKEIASMGFDGYGIGGSFAKEDMGSAVIWVNEELPEGEPRHLLGIGEPEDLCMGVENGVDLFDCVGPTRMARTGTLYTADGKLNITNARFRDDFTPLDPSCGCPTCRTYTRAYLSHLYRSKEMLAATLGSVHNLYFLASLVERLRQAILDGNFVSVRDAFLARYRAGSAVA